MNRFPLWKNLLVLLVLGAGLLYAAPNLFPDDAAVQVSRLQSGEAVSNAALDQVRVALERADIAVKEAVLDGGNALVRLSDRNQQLAAKEVIERTLNSTREAYIVALNLAATTPDWLRALGAKPMKLGLDLSGGVHFLMEVDLATAIGQRLSIYQTEIQRGLREARIRYREVGLLPNGQGISLRFADPEARSAARDWIQDQYDQWVVAAREADGAWLLELRFSEGALDQLVDYAVSQNLTTLRNRVNELGVAEPLVQRQGRDRIVVELPGVQDTAQAKNILGKTANLEFRLEADAGDDAPGSERFGFRDPTRGSAELEREIVATGENVANAQSGYDENGMPQVNISLDSEGGRRMHQATRSNVGRRLGVLFVEQKVRYDEQERDGEAVREPVTYTDRTIISLATVQSALGRNFRVTGLDSPQEAAELALLLRAGALAAPMRFIEERTVGPSLGKENIALGTRSVLVGMGLVLVFMGLYYKLFGLAANLALMANLVLLIAVMSVLSATLTLPGIAGIVLTVGMAVDANVLIFARIREELANRMSPQAAINAGFERAFTTIFDANLTTLIVALILYAVGTGPIKGFAVTLSIGILTSMFTAILGTRMVVNWMYGGRRVDRLAI